VHCTQVGRHVVLTVELFVAHFAGVGIALEMGGHVVPVKVTGVCVGVVADLASVGVLWRRVQTSSLEIQETSQC